MGCPADEAADNIKKRKGRDLPSPQAKLPKSGVRVFIVLFLVCAVDMFLFF